MSTSHPVLHLSAKIKMYGVRISAALAERLSVLAFRLGYYYILMTGNLFVKESSSIISYCTLLNCLNFVTSQLEGTLKSCF